MNNKENRIKELVNIINDASDSYYNGKGEKMSDYDWDKLFNELTLLEDETGLVLPNSPTHNVSSDSFNGKKEAHEFPALSLAKTKQISELVKWADNRPIWMSWKLDGLTLVVTYDNGKLSKIVTRGNGHIGTNITFLADAIDGIPNTIPSLGHIIIRGECLISYKDFNSFINESNESYSNPRNLASGSLLLKDINEVKKRHLQFVPFTLVSCNEEINSWGERMNFINKNGLHSVAHELIKSPTLESISEAVETWSERIKTLPVDGLVICYDDYQYSISGNVTGHHSVRGGFAYKWKDDYETATLDHIEWSCAMSTISPVAVFLPIELEGTIVKRASLYNISECERLNIGDKGSLINVIKANKIIPKVIETSKKIGELIIPNVCPVCGAPTKIEISDKTNIKTLHCTNKDCISKQLSRFKRFVSKDGMNMEGISSQTILALINNSLLTKLSDFYLLKDHLNEMIRIDGIGEKKAELIIDAIEKSKNVNEFNVLYSLVIPMIGHDACKKLFNRFNINAIILGARNACDNLVFSAFDIIGEKTSNALVDFFKNDKNYDETLDLLKYLKISEYKETTANAGKCSGLTFAITGKLTSYENRNELIKDIEKHGGTFSATINKNVNYLINNDTLLESGKNKKAKKLNIPIISEIDFVNKFTHYNTLL